MKELHTSKRFKLIHFLGMASINAVVETLKTGDQIVASSQVREEMCCALGNRAPTPSTGLIF